MCNSGFMFDGNPESEGYRGSNGKEVSPCEEREGDGPQESVPMPKWMTVACRPRRKIVFE